MSEFLKDGHKAADPPILITSVDEHAAAARRIGAAMNAAAMASAGYQRHRYLFERKIRVAVFLSRQRRPKRHA